jgi:hypothetical protein
LVVPFKPAPYIGFRSSRLRLGLARARGRGDIQAIFPPHILIRENRRLEITRIFLEIVHFNNFLKKKPLAFVYTGFAKLKSSFP